MVRISFAVLNSSMGNLEKRGRGRPKLGDKAKVRCNLTLDRQLVARAKAAGINISAVAEVAIRHQLDQ